MFYVKNNVNIADGMHYIATIITIGRNEKGSYVQLDKTMFPFSPKIKMLYEAKINGIKIKKLSYEDGVKYYIDSNMIFDIGQEIEFVVSKINNFKK